MLSNAEAKMEGTVTDNMWETEKHIRFTMASTKDIEELKLFFHQSYFPDEAVQRSIKTMQGSGWIDNCLRSRCERKFIIDPISKVTVTPASIIARSTRGNNAILGCRIGAIWNRADCEETDVPYLLWVANLPTYLPITKKLIDMSNMAQLLLDLHYGKRQAFDELKAAKRMYFAASLCISDNARGMGLGTGLVRRGYDIAVKACCDYTYVLATSLYSQRIFHKLGNVTILNEVSYEDYKYDRKGRPFLGDPREHKVIQLLAIQHKPI